MSRDADLPEVRIDEVGPEYAGEVTAVIHAAFAGRPPLDPPATALRETEESVRRELSAHGGLLATVHDRPVGALLFRRVGTMLGLRRVGVLAEVRQLGVAARLARVAEGVAESRGCSGLVLEAREELPATVRFWHRQGYMEVDAAGPRLQMVRMLPVVRRLATAEDTRAMGVGIGALLMPGDLVILSGDLGAGKTTLTQGIGEGMHVRGPITSPTFVIARVHPSLAQGPPLVHVDAYRLGGAAELDDLDLDTDVENAVTVVEWGDGVAEALAGSRLMIELERDPDDVRTLRMTPVGRRWAEIDLRGLGDALA